MKFFKELISHDAPRRHKLSVHILSTAEQGEAESKPAPDGLSEPPKQREVICLFIITFFVEVNWLSP